MATSADDSFSCDDGSPQAVEDDRDRNPSASLISVSSLECGVCLSLVCQPVSLSCGHSFCRICLINTLRRNKKKCPTCRAVCHNSAEDQPEDVMIANIATTCFPELSARRLREVEADRHTWSTVLPVFYYNMPMFPGESLCLHLFEPRYKLMIQRIVNTTRRFAYVPNYTDYTASVGDVALVAELCDCEFLHDGRVLLDAKLASRQTVAEHFVEEGTQGLHYCRLEPLVDAPPVGDEAAANLAELHESTRALAEQLISPVRGQIVQRFGEMPLGAEELSLWVASVLPMPAGDKHELLSGTSTSVRLEACQRHLSSLVSSNASPVPPTRVPASAVAEAYQAYQAALHGGAEADAAADAAVDAAAAAVSSGAESPSNRGDAAFAGGEGKEEEEEEEEEDDDSSGVGDGQGDEDVAVAQLGPEDMGLGNSHAIAAYERVMAEARASLDTAAAAAAREEAEAGSEEEKAEGRSGAGEPREGPERRQTSTEEDNSVSAADPREGWESVEEKDEDRRQSIGR